MHTEKRQILKSDRRHTQAISATKLQPRACNRQVQTARHGSVQCPRCVQPTAGVIAAKRATTTMREAISTALRATALAPFKTTNSRLRTAHEPLLKHPPARQPVFCCLADGTAIFAARRHHLVCSQPDPGKNAGCGSLGGRGGGGGHTHSCDCAASRASIAGFKPSKIRCVVPQTLVDFSLPSPCSAAKNAGQPAQSACLSQLWQNCQDEP
jgi:hypothetical protein